MGSAASVEERNTLINLIATVRTSRGEEQADALKQLWDIAEHKDHKLPLTEPSLGLVDAIVGVLKVNSNEQAVDNALGVLWFISRSDPASVVLSKVPELSALVSELFRSPKYTNITVFPNPCMAYLGNLVRFEESSLLVQALEPPFFLPMIQFLDASSESSLRVRTIINFQNICKHATPKTVQHILEMKIADKILSILKGCGPNPTYWPDRIGDPNTCMYCLLNLVTYPEAAIALGEMGAIAVMEPLMNTRGAEGLLAVLLMSALVGRRESSQSRQALLEQFPSVVLSLVECLQAALDGGQGDAFNRMDAMVGYKWALLHLHLILTAIKNLSISEANKKVLSSNELLLPQLLALLDLYISDSRPIVGLGVHFDGFNTIGGGGKDHRTAAIILDSMINLSFAYEDEEELRKRYMVPSLEIPNKMQILLALPAGRNVPETVKRGAGILLRKLTPQPLTFKAVPALPVTSAAPNSFALSQPSAPASAPAASVPRQHLMISYSWAAHKPYVVALAHQLRLLGFDVWRDDEGSSIEPKLAGDVEEALACAIQSAHSVIVCVSPEYKESANCRSEAQCCRNRHTRDGMKMHYVMMNKDYTTVTAPRKVDGWLMFMMGGELWYPLWSEDQIVSTVNELARIIGDGHRSDAIAAHTVVNPPGVVMKTRSESAVNVAPVTTTSAAPAGRDWEKAWTLLEQANKPVIQEKLVEHDVDSAEYLSYLKDEELVELSELFGTAKRRAFLQALSISIA